MNDDRRRPAEVKILAIPDGRPPLGLASTRIGARVPAAGRTAGVSRNAAARWRDRATGRAAPHPEGDWSGRRIIFRSAPTIEQARRSGRLMTACRCATAARLAAGPTIFLKGAREGQPHRASARPEASSASHSPPPAPSARLASKTSMPPNLAFQL
jgi:hypothetical protein